MADSYLFNPHDKFFKESFSRKEIARSFIREYLPESIIKQLDFQSLTILKDSFIDKELSEHFSDILYRVKLSGMLSYIYLLFEHKSYIDPWTGFQILRNMVKVWEQYRKQHKKVKRLPVILPIVIYQGSEKWKMKSSIAHLFGDLTNTKDYIPEFKCEVFDISHIPDEEIRGEILLRVHFLAQKYIGRGLLFEKLHEIFTLLSSLSEKRTKMEYLETLLRYLSATSDSGRIRDIKIELEKSIEIGGEIMPTIAEKWLQDGVEKGKLEGKLEDAEKMIKEGMDNELIARITGFTIEKIEVLRKKAYKS